MPNIFRFAPSELSQDAMFIWLARCATTSDAALRRLGNAFVQFLLKAGGGKVFDGNDQSVPYSGSGVVSKFLHGPGKHRNMDVYFAAEMDDRTKVSVVIEDKIGTTKHSNQLRRYREIVKSDNIEEDFTKLVYLKTGMPFDDEKDLVASEGYSFVGIHDLEGFLVAEPSASCTSDLVQQYREWTIEKRKEMDIAERDWNMEYGPIQHRFLSALRKRVGDSAKDDPSKGRNRGGGGAFSQLHIQHSESDSWPLFWRIDPWLPLCLRFRRGEKEENAALVKDFRSMFDKAMEGTGQQPAKGRKWKAKAWEPTIGGIEFPKANRSQEMEPFLDAVAQVHRRFLDLLHRSPHSED